MNKSNEQKHGGKGSTLPHNQNTTVLPKDGSQGPGKIIRQEQQNPAKDYEKAPPRAAKNDGGNQRQESKKS